MKLTDEQIEMIRNKCADNDVTCCGTTIRHLLDTIEALQQEIEQLKGVSVQCARHTAGIIDLAAENVKLQQENEQLQARAAMMREALKIADDKVRIYETISGECGAMYVPLMNHGEISKIKEALSTTPIDYHNPADVAEIERLKDENISIRAWNKCVDKDYPKLLEENRQLQCTLFGVMHSVDKWFDEVDEDTDEVNRAAQAREIALQAIEKRDDALTKAKEALELIYKKHTDILNHDKYPRTCSVCENALSAMSEVLK